MRVVGEQLVAWQERLGRHEFFTRFQTSAELIAIAPRFKFWVLVFQDVLRLNEACVRDPKLKAMAARHRREDGGHEEWFVEDLKTLGVADEGADVLFDKGHAPTRDFSYAIVSEVSRIVDDHLRIVLILALESMGHVFFGWAADIADRDGLSRNLRYFGRSHVDVEHQHDLFEHDSVAALEKDALSDEVRAEATALIDRVHQAFTVLLDSFVRSSPRDS